MTEGQLAVEVDPGPWPEPEHAHCWPVRATVTGMVSWDSPKPTKIRSLTVELRWRTEGRGDTDQASAARQELAKGQLPPGQHRWPFQLALPPEGPITYEGHLIRIIWELRAFLDVARGPDLEFTVPVTVLPDYDLGQLAAALA